MSQQHAPKNPIKPPLHYLRPSSGIPSLPKIDQREAVGALTNGDWSARVVAGRHITCLRQIITSLMAVDTLPADFDQVVFDHVVIEQGDLSELDVPFKLHFQDVSFLNGLNLNSSRFPFLSISGYIGYGLSLVETKGKPMVNLANLEADQVWIYGGEGVDHLDVSDSTIGILTVASTKVEGEIFLRDSAVSPDGLWFENLSVGRAIYVSRCTVQKYFRIHDVSCTGDIRLEVCNLDAPLSTRNSTCAKLGLSESKCSGRLDFRDLSFHDLDVSNVSVPGQLLLNIDQLQCKKNTAGFAAPWRQKWDIPPRLSAQKSATLGELVTVAEQLIALHENFRRIPTAEPQDRYCAYQLADSTWQSCCWWPVDRLTKWIVKQGAGYLLLPARIVRTMVVSIILWAFIFFAFPTLGIGGLSFSDGTSILQDGTAVGIGRCLYFSTLTFCTSVYGDIYPVGAMKAVAAAEAFAGLIAVGLFVVSLARRLFRW